MPELPEVETIRRQLAPWLTGRLIEGVELLAPMGPKYAGLERAAGHAIESVNRRGKYLLLPLLGEGGSSPDYELVVHLGMTGVLRPAEAERHKHLRVRLELAGPDPTGLDFIDPRRFGRFTVVAKGEYESLPTLKELGPEPLDHAFTPELFAANLARSRVAIKSYLLSQRPVAGVGNIYADEALWRAGVHPLTPAAAVELGRVAALLGALRDVLGASLEAQGTTLNDYRTVYGESGDYMGSLDVYGRAGAECRRCGGPLERMVVGQRGTTYCPECQRLPRLRDGEWEDE